jgi:hypothetical protein
MVGGDKTLDDKQDDNHEGIATVWKYSFL